MVEFLIDNHGIKKLQEYLKYYIKTPDKYLKIFMDVYSFDLNTVLNDFNSSLQE